ncbi:hypothetical protein K431DRAFT_309225 [Polychaeton citri CBS 116435]|uniref:ZN622/Rei1/Reh1 zinc finger C2H2-type domain-containing protein n=1 Tax=Polychaeton citri CBS 116435 TaxID=1314669 RepID=A0A9P4QIP4_9PEZI|nr:hypothetical protein K431DRAFT_309225 [Polychaeton citri CBS 116435]
MEAESDRSDFVNNSSREQTPNGDEGTSSPSIDYQFDESQCLFCNQANTDLEQNLVHMSKAHGLYLDHTNLPVDALSLLAYLNIVISGCYECLYCRTQRNTRQAVQQHMMAKGHCKYDIADKNAELKDFYQISSSDEEDEQRQTIPATRFLDDPQLPSHPRSRRPRSRKRSDRHSPDVTAFPFDQSPPDPTAHSHVDAVSGSDAAAAPSHSLGKLSTRALRQDYMLNNHLTQLRADDRRSLLHLPSSQQRALLATHHKQMEKAKRIEQTRRSNLESAANSFGCLGKIRLMRKPPHTGNIHSLKR